MTQYTAFGFYSDTGLKYASQQGQDSPEACIQRIKDLYPDESITIVCVIEGEHQDCLDGEYIEDTSDWDQSKGGDNAPKTNIS